MRTQIANLLLTFVALAIVGVASANDFQKIDDYLDQLQQAAAFDGIVFVSRDQAVLHERSFGFANYAQATPIDASTRFLIGDLAQIVTRAAIGRLVDDEKLTFRSRLADFLPEFPDARRITISHLLEHTSGVVDTRDLAWVSTPQAETLDGVIEGLSAESLRFKPGVRQLQSNGGYALLAKVIEIVSEQSYADFIRTEFAENSYPSFSQSNDDDTTAQIPLRYVPDQTFGERAHANPKLARSVVAGVSLRSSAPDLVNFVSDAYSGKLLSETSTSVLFPTPTSGFLKFSSERSDAFAHLEIDLDERESFLILSSNAARPANLAANVLALYAGEHIALRPISTASKRTPLAELEMFVGRYRSRNIEVEIQLSDNKETPLFVQGTIATAFSATAAGDYYLPYYDWLCRFSAYNTEFECQERTGISTAPVLFERM